MLLFGVCFVLYISMLCRPFRAGGLVRAGVICRCEISESGKLCLKKGPLNNVRFLGVIVVFWVAVFNPFKFS